MNDKNAYQRKMQAQLDEWKADLDKIKAKANAASADAEIAFNNNDEVKELEQKVAHGEKKLEELSQNKKSGNAWQSVKGGMQSSWQSLQNAFQDAAAKFKN